MDFTKDVEQCVATLAQGGIIIYPTDTVWALGCDATNPIAVEKIVALKQQPANKGLVLITASERDIMQHAATLDLSIFDFLAEQAAPTTVIYPNAVGLAPNVLADDGSAAIRITQDEFCRHLIKRFRKPVVSTTVNTIDNPIPIVFKGINPSFIHAADYVVQYRQDDIYSIKPSTIIAWENNSSRIVRP